MCDREAAGKRGAADRAEGKAGKTGRCGSGGRKSGESWAARIRRKEKRGKLGGADRAEGKAEKRGAADRAEGKVCRQLCGGGEDKQNLRFVEHGEEWN